jgi:UDP-N-acetylmuramoyl-tripeptide--D-alanyl-D-alanine ligase
MKQFSLDWILQVTHGKSISHHQSVFNGYTTDSRQNCQQLLFVALVGESFDAHNFIHQACQNGAAAVLVHRLPAEIEALKSKITFILVDDTLIAFQKMATAIKQSKNVQVIGLTGSNGKTTTKEYIAATISQDLKTHWSSGSFNNHWGVPMTLLDMSTDAEVAVVEMGMNHAGEITRLIEIADPDIVLCTMVGRAHIEHFGTIEKIASAKEEIYEAARPEATRIYNLDNTFVRKMYEKAQSKFLKSRLITFSEHEKSDVQFKIIEASAKELAIKGSIDGCEQQVKLNLFGSHNLTNLMAAASAALAVGLAPEKIWQGLKNCKTTWGRNQFVSLANGAEMIFDAYNANPDSMAALLANTASLKVKGQKIGVFGQMKELGEHSAQLHFELGQAIGQQNFSTVYFVGEDFKKFNEGLVSSSYRGEFVGDHDFAPALGEALSQKIKTDDLVIVKGSRGMKLERFVDFCSPVDFSKTK